MDTYRTTLSSHARLNSAWHIAAAYWRRYELLPRRGRHAEHVTSAYTLPAVSDVSKQGRHPTLTCSSLPTAQREQAGERSLTRLEEIQALSEIIQVNAEVELPPFSGDGRYFKIHEVSDLLAGTGTSADDSENLFTTRLLLLLESKCVINDALYDDASKRIINMYFETERAARTSALCSY